MPALVHLHHSGDPVPFPFPVDWPHSNYFHILYSDYIFCLYGMPFARWQGVMISQPIHFCASLVRSAWENLTSAFSGRNLSIALVPVFAIVPNPVQAVADAPLAGESALVVMIAGLAGLLGLSAALLYRHMHREEERSQSRAQNAEAELRALLMMTDEAVLVLDPDGTVREANPASEEFFAHSLDQFPGMPLTGLIAQPLCLSELTKYGPVNFETTAIRHGGEYPKVEMLLSPVEFGGITSYVALVHDSKGAVPSGISRISESPDLSKPVEKFTHDLNNELTTIIGNLSLILMSPPSDPANQERILNAKRTAVRAHALTQGLQQLASGEDNQSNTTDESPATERTIVRMPNPNISGSPSANSISTPPASHTPRILVLDDEDAICALVATALNSMGFEVTEATSAAHALRACTDAMKEGNAYDLVISDLSLPGDMSGSDAVSRLRDIDPRIKAIVSSGYENDPIMSDCQKHGFAAAMAKPYDIAKLGRTVREVLSSSVADIRKTA